MKTINVSDEVYSSLMELSKEINNQDHRSTAMPYFFQIRETKQIDGVSEEYSPDGYVWICPNGDGTIDNNRESMIEELEQADVEFDKDITNDNLEELMAENGYKKGYFRNEEIYSNAFLTAKACKEHIKLNSYHYSEPVDYLTHAFRNPELELILKFLCELTDGKLHK